MVHLADFELLLLLDLNVFILNDFIFMICILSGNEFSTLDGVVFEWSIVSLKKKKNLSVLRFMTFKESTYEAHPSITALEDQNKRGYTVLLEGVKTGSAKVTNTLTFCCFKT